MPIRFACPTCQKTFTVKDELGGKRVVCAACKGPMTVPLAAAELPLEPAPYQAQAQQGMSCPTCQRPMAPGAVLCTNCGHDLRKGKAVRTVVAHTRPIKLKAAGSSWLTHPLTYMVPALLLYLLLVAVAPGAAAAGGILLMLMGLLALLASLVFAIPMYKAAYDEYGIAPILGAFCGWLVPIVAFCVNLWLVIRYWRYAHRAVTCFVGGIVLVMAGALAPKALAIRSMAVGSSYVAPESNPFFPVMPEASHPEPGVDLYEMRMGGSGPGTGIKIALYMPASAAGAAEHSVPCILIAPAGTTMLTGAMLTPGDQREHLPYVRRGFAVAAYELDGALSAQATNSDFVSAVKAFRAARAGVTDAKNVLDFLLAKVPAIDPEHVYAVGHSSAGGLALNVAAADPRIRAVVAYAPGTDIVKRQPAKLFDVLRRSIWDIDVFAKEASPIAHVKELNCPVYLFNAADDDVVNPAEVQAFADALRAAGKTVEVQTVASGGHYNAMIREGITQGIAWLKPLTPALNATEVAMAKRRQEEEARAAAAPSATPTTRIAEALPETGLNPQRPAATSPAFPGRGGPVVGGPGRRPGFGPAGAGAAGVGPRVARGGNQDPIPYTIPGPDGFEKVDSGIPGMFEWRKTVAGHVESSRYTVMVRKVPASMPAPSAAGGNTLEANGIVFRQTFSTSRSAVFIARDGEYQLTIQAFRDPEDAMAAGAMNGAAKRIRRASIFPTTAP